MESRAWILGVVASAMCLAGNGAAANGLPGPETVVLEMDGHKITLADFERAHPTAMFQARNTYYETQKRAIEAYAQELLLQQQARKENLSVTQLLEKHVMGTLPKDPPDEVLRVYYEGVDTKEPFEAVRDKIAESIRQRRAIKARTAYVDSLRAKANVSVRLAPPRVVVELNDTPVRGPRNAPVTLIEYADYECPYCQQIQPALDRLRTEYKDRLAFVYKDVPLPSHPNAQKAAEAAHCAGVQGKYWEYHDAIVTSKSLAVASLKETAKGLQLEPGAFNKCLDGGDKADVIKATLAEAQDLGIEGTPSYLINGRFFSGIMTYEALRDIVEEEIRAARAKQESAKR